LLICYSQGVTQTHTLTKFDLIQSLKNMTSILKSTFLFILAGLCEIGGGYLVWLWLKGGKSLWIGVIGLIILGLYGVVATWQSANFGRVYAAYGGVFIVLAILWGWKVDGITPDKFDLFGGAIALLGMAVIMFAPRNC
jgi:small multidrug resistance family-3 protein